MIMTMKNGSLYNQQKPIHTSEETEKNLENNTHEQITKHKKFAQCLFAFCRPLYCLLSFGGFLSFCWGLPATSHSKSHSKSTPQKKIRMIKTHQMLFPETEKNNRNTLSRLACDKNVNIWENENKILENTHNQKWYMRACRGQE